MRCASSILLCLLVFSLTACASNTQRQNELATANLQVSVTDLNYRMEMLEQRLATMNSDVSVLKNHPYPVKTTKGLKTNFIANAPSAPAPQPLMAAPVPAPQPLVTAPVPAPAPRPLAAAPAPAPMFAPGAAPPSQQQGDGWLSPYAPPPPARGSATKPTPASAPTPAPSAQAPKARSPQDQPQNIPVVQTKRPADVDDLALPPEMPSVPQQPTLAPPTPAAPQTASTPAPRAGRQPSPPVPQAAANQSEEVIYNSALADFNAGKFAQAATGFTELMYTYPSGRYAPNAGYWLGESLYGQQQDNNALAQFSEVVSRFPQHHKAPDALFKAGLCYMRLGDRESASSQFRALVAGYPNSSAANLARQRGYVR